MNVQDCHSPFWYSVCVPLNWENYQHFSPNWEILLSYNHLKIISAEDLSQDTYDHEHLNMQTYH